MTVKKITFQCIIEHLISTLISSHRNNSLKYLELELNGFWFGSIPHQGPLQIIPADGDIVVTADNKKVREKSRVCHNHKPQPIPDTEEETDTTKQAQIEQTYEKH